MAAYSNQEKVEGQIQRALTADELVNLDTKIASWSDAISNFLNRFWNDIDDEGEPEDTIKIFDGENPRELFISDFQSISKIEMLDSAGDVYETIEDEDEWILYPLNSATKESIVLRSYRFPYGYARIRITGVFTSGTVPESIVGAVTSLIANEYLLKEDVGEFESESIEGYSYKIKSQTQGDFNSSMEKIYASVMGYQRVLF